jgi:hypothetical protein
LKVEKFEGGNVRKVGLLGRLTPKCHSLEPGDVSVTCSIPPRCHPFSVRNVIHAPFSLIGISIVRTVTD